MERRDVFILESIIEFCDRIISTISDDGIDFDVFQDNPNYQDMLAFRVEQIGELVNNLSDNFKQNNPEMEWHKMVGFRNIVAHAYGSVNMLLLWDILINNIPSLRDFCAKKINYNK